MEEENIPAITSLSYHEIRKRYREKTDELNEKRLNVVSDYVQLVMSPYLKESDVNMLINNINLWLESEDNILIPVTTGGRLTTLDLRHLAWNIGERFNWKGIKRALFIKLVFPIEMRELEVETIRRNLRQNGNCIIELDIPEKGFFEFSISSRPTQNLLSHAKMTKYISQDLLCVDGTTSDFCKVMEALTEVFGNEVARKIQFQSINGALDVEEGIIKGLLMADVGDRNATEKLLLQPIHAFSCKCLKVF